MKKDFKILSIDGGGARGIYPAHILKELQRNLKIDFLEEFDMIAGTSTGSIIAAALAFEIPIDKICEMYENLSDQIFVSEKIYGINLGAKGLLKSKYSNKTLKNILEDNFGQLKMKDARKPLLIPATNIASGAIHLHQNNPGLHSTGDEEMLVVDAVLSSCSAPTYFDPITVRDSSNVPLLLADGGIWANNPSMIALSEAISPKGLNQKLENIKVFSIGTGTSKKTFDFSNKNWGLTGWGSDLIPLIISLQSQNPHIMLDSMLPEDRYVRINFESSEKLPLDIYDEKIKIQADQDFRLNAKKIEKFFKDENLLKKFLQTKNPFNLALDKNS